MNKMNSLSYISYECRTGNHDACPEQIFTPRGNMDCRCINHDNEPVSVDDTPVSKDASWRVTHDG